MPNCCIPENFSRIAEHKRMMQNRGCPYLKMYKNDCRTYQIQQEETHPGYQV